ncbi:MAG: NTP transferase domain-containing protein [Clostridia bacterium]|nr:NTP transferase domain-containing protein [Clostridia bacterium]
MKGILLGGGKATRLYPITKVITKHLLPVYDKPMIYYSLSLLMYANVKEILIITDSSNLGHYKKILGNGSDFGLNISYCIQKQPHGIAEAILLGADFIKNDQVCLVLGDTILYSDTLEEDIIGIRSQLKDCAVIACRHSHPEHFGVAFFNDDGQLTEIKEKPVNPSSDYVIPGLYFYDNTCVKKAENLRPSLRGELEITDLNNEYLKAGKLQVSKLDNLQYIDAGQYDSLLSASNFIRKKQEEESIVIGDIKRTASEKGWI